MEPKLIVAGIDVHKKMLAVVVVDEDHPQQAREQRKFATNGSDLKHLAAWLDSHGVSLVVMESTALYWRRVWLALEGWRTWVRRQRHSRRPNKWRPGSGSARDGKKARGSPTGTGNDRPAQFNQRQCGRSRRSRQPIRPPAKKQAASFYAYSRPPVKRLCLTLRI